MSKVEYRRWISAAIVGLTACGSPAQPGIGSSGIVTSGEGLLLVDADRSAVSWLDRAGEHRELTVGKEPARLLRLGEATYVSLRGERTIVELLGAGKDLRIGRRFTVGAEPYGLAALKDGSRLFVACGLAGTVEEIDLLSGSVVRTFPVPDQPRWLAASATHVYVGSALAGTVTSIQLSTGVVAPVEMPSPREALTGHPMIPRITGDLSLSPNGTNLVVPVQLTDSRVVDPDLATTAYYGPRITSGFLPAVVDIPIDADGTPADGAITVTPIGSNLSYPTSVIHDASGANIYVAFEGSSVVFSLPAVPSKRPLYSGLVPSLSIETNYPESFAIDDDGQVFVRSRLLRKVLVSQARRDDGLVSTMPIGALPASGLAPEIERGRRLFFDAIAETTGPMGLSCSSCHFEGRTDGLTWVLPGGPRNTPSLAEQVSERAPLRWSGDRTSVADDAQQTAALLGGSLTNEQAEDLQRFVESIPGVDLPLHGAPQEMMSPGRRAFERAGCAGCHGGKVLSDLVQHELGGRGPVKTPSLTGVAATPPFLHDGSVATLEELVERARELELGDTSMLSKDERAALVTYLKSL